jgi:hypothetical protein
MTRLQHSGFLPIFMIVLISSAMLPLCLDAQTPMVFKGRVINASRDSIGVENIPVLLQRFYEKQESAPVEIDRKESGKNGLYQFRITIPDSASVVAFADYQSVRYYSHVVPPSSRSITIDHNIAVYDTSHQTGNVEILMHHLFVDDKNGSAGFRETLILNNPTRFALTHRMHEPQIGEATFRFTLPPSGINYEILSPAFGNEMTIQNGTLYDRGIALPGNRQISYSYEIPWQENEVKLSLAIDYPSRTLDLFTSSEKISVLGDNVLDHGPFQIRSVQYHRYGVTGITTGTDVSLVIKRSGAPPPRQSPQPVIIITAVILGCGLGYSLLKHRRQA